MRAHAASSNIATSSSAAAFGLSPSASPMSAAAARVSPVNADEGFCGMASSNQRGNGVMPPSSSSSSSSSLLFDQWGVPPSLEKKYVVGPEVGRGSCSVVREVICRETGDVFVAKICSIKDTTAFNPEEAEVVMAARHDNIVRGVDVFTSATHSALVMEDLRRGGELFQLVQRSNAAGGSTAASVTSPTSPSATSVSSGGGLPECVVAKLVHDVLSGLHYLHDVMGVVHRDIKLENIMLVHSHESHTVDDDVGSDGILFEGQGRGAAYGAKNGGGGGDIPVAKLIDFGFSKRIGGSKVLKSCCGSPNYMSPEMLRASRTQDQNAAALPTRHLPYGNEVDMWATGVLMYVMLVGKYPFYSERRSVWHKSILLGQYQLPSTVAVSVSGRDLLAKLLTVRSEDRLRASEALAHPWFREFEADTQGALHHRHSLSTPPPADRPASKESLVYAKMMSTQPHHNVSIQYMTPPRKVHTPPVVDEPAAAAVTAAYLLSPPQQSAAMASAFTPPHNHALFMDTPMSKTPPAGGASNRSINAALL